MLKICAKNVQDATWVLLTAPILCFLLTFRLLDIGRMLLLRSMLTNFLPISPILTSSLTPFTFSFSLISSSEWSSGTRGLQIFSVVWNKNICSVIKDIFIWRAKEIFSLHPRSPCFVHHRSHAAISEEERNSIANMFQFWQYNIFDIDETIGPELFRVMHWFLGMTHSKLVITNTNTNTNDSHLMALCRRSCCWTARTRWSRTSTRKIMLEPSILFHIHIYVLFNGWVTTCF